MYNIEYLSIEQNKEYEKTISTVLSECFKIERLPEDKLIVGITLTNPEHIKTLNSKYRNIDKETDVLSFPMFEKEELARKIKQDNWQNEDILGDMVISIQRVKEQAIEYGHSFERELSYMIVHSFYHLIGYDHMKEEDKKIMRAKEETVLEKLGIIRT